MMTAFVLYQPAPLFFELGTDVILTSSCGTSVCVIMSASFLLALWHMPNFLLLKGPLGLSVENSRTSRTLKFT